MNQDLRSLATDAPPHGERQAFRRLHALGRIGLRSVACLAARGARADCRCCIEACPRASLALHDGGLELDPVACSSCGICAASCPTGALAVEGFTLPAVVPPQGITVACERVHGAAPGAAHRVPCLGGLALTDWLRLALTAGDAPLRIVDDGSCTHCANATGAGEPAIPLLDAARRALTEAGVPAESLPQRVKPAPLPNGNEGRNASADEVVASRRGFFAGLSRSVASALTQTTTGDAQFAAPARIQRPRRDTIPGQRGEETRLLLLQIAQRHGRPHPVRATLPALAANSACRAHGACTGVCPTGALQLESDADNASAHLRFDAWLCVACGACSGICPSRALTLEPRAWRPFAVAPVELAVIGQCECRRCGALFAAGEDESLCERCRKTEALARAGFALFHRHRETPAAPEGP
ncbi:4Fe-4S dicluster domain-containing protein [Aromatoleum diolicum]|uniref:4Fe-4S dicluster domain-containing protein n=1 Tax=Aromatoleum diolicum TaxID=75796 RepID=A0ABX1Q4I4_9RHOO|nr:4Fe-4S dicluster domain-containing protein [Aromatoleum diolicum]NMG73264.1 4Fe-4S dicluster domain-containing protein [Aromatoleum diolicum]